MKKLSTIIKEKLEIDIDEGRFPFKYSYEQYLKDNSEFNNLMETTKLLNEEFKKDLEFDIEYFDFIINKNTQLVLSLSIPLITKYLN
ncbi:hypothetical protein PG331_04105 [Riemerella anatipestifer]|nr:hypothetical protein [Riemerella anatipestifer]